MKRIKLYIKGEYIQEGYDTVTPIIPVVLETKENNMEKLIKELHANYENVQIIVHKNYCNFHKITCIENNLENMGQKIGYLGNLKHELKQQGLTFDNKKQQSFRKMNKDYNIKREQLNKLKEKAKNYQHSDKMQSINNLLNNNDKLKEQGLYILDFLRNNAILKYNLDMSSWNDFICTTQGQFFIYQWLTQHNAYKVDKDTENEIGDYLNLDNLGSGNEKFFEDINLDETNIEDIYDVELDLDVNDYM